jgi:hypothetical protein
LNHFWTSGNRSAISPSGRSRKIVSGKSWTHLTATDSACEFHTGSYVQAAFGTVVTQGNLSLNINEEKAKQSHTGMPGSELSFKAAITNQIQCKSSFQISANQVFSNQCKSSFQIRYSVNQVLTGIGFVACREMINFV